MSTRDDLPLHKAWRRFAARLGLCGLLLQSLFPAVFSTLLLGSPAMADAIVLCTADGPKTVSLADIGAAPLSETPAKSVPHAPYCPACPGYFQANAALAPTVIALAAPGWIEVALAYALPESAAPALRFAPQSPRAPPSFA
ncbi:MAG TPA: DUF2946 family protein [Alphaproteobacteria bacterium]|jgi:hypothetical protein